MARLGRCRVLHLVQMCLKKTSQGHVFEVCANDGHHRVMLSYHVWTELLVRLRRQPGCDGTHVA